MIEEVNDRVQFIQEIELEEDNSLERCIKEYFDQMMCAYHINKQLSLSSIKMDCDGRSTNFSISYNDDQTAELIESKLKDNNIIDIYRSRFQVNVIRTNNNLNVTFILLTKK